MELQRVVIIHALLMAGFGSTKANFPPGCSMEDISEQHCVNLGEQEPQNGNWSEVRRISLYEKGFSSLSREFFTGMKELQSLDVSGNPLQVLDLRHFLESQHLSSLLCRTDTLEELVPLDPDQELPEFHVLAVSGKFTEVPQNLLQGLSKIVSVLIQGENFVVPGDHPVLVSDSLESLSLRGTNAGKISRETFKALPALAFLNLVGSGVKDVSQAFLPIPRLRFLLLSKNPIEEVNPNFLTADIMGRVTLDLSSTPLACSCNYEEIYRLSLITEENLFRFRFKCSTSEICCPFRHDCKKN